MFRPRETMIALRARHEAMEVSHDMAYPPLALPRPPEPAIKLTPAEIDYAMPPSPPSPAERRARYEPAPLPTSEIGRFLMSDLVLSIAGIVIGLAIILLCKYG
jgi:hypothetical protein